MRTLLSPLIIVSSDAFCSGKAGIEDSLEDSGNDCVGAASTGFSTKVGGAIVVMSLGGFVNAPYFFSAVRRKMVTVVLKEELTLQSSALSGVWSHILQTAGRFD